MNNISKDSLGDRIKSYEDKNRNYLQTKQPVIMRLDGRAFHTLTKIYFKKPYDFDFSSMMCNTAIKVFSEISGAKIAYTQSDEISILITDYDKEETQAWFGYNIQKMTSIAASIASTEFMLNFFKIYNPIYLEDVPDISFDCRVFNIPKEDIANYFIWRQRDCERNSVQSFAQFVCGHKILQKKNITEQKELIIEYLEKHKTENNKKYEYVKSMFFTYTDLLSWDALDDFIKYGTFIIDESEILGKIFTERIKYSSFNDKYLKKE